MLINKYEIISSICNGEFGQVFKVYYNNKYYALKCGAKEVIKYEIQIYKHLGSLSNISSIYDVFLYKDCMCMVMDLYSMTLVDYKLQNYYNEHYNERCFTIIKELLIIIKSIHANNIIHRDLKPTNICMDANNKIYLIDFGIAKIYKHSNVHVKETQIKSLIGSVNYSSLNVLRLIEPSRRDDIETIIYILLYLLLSNETYKLYDNLNVLEKKDIDIVIKFLQDKNNNNNKNMDFLIIEKLFKYIRRLKYDQTPNYEYIMLLINESYLH